MAANTLHKTFDGQFGLSPADTDDCIQALNRPYLARLEVAAGTDEAQFVAIALAPITITAAYVIPTATTAASGTNYASIAIQKRDTAAGAATAVVTAMTTASVALTDNTKRSFTVSATVANTQLAKGDVLEVVHDQSNGTGAAVAGMLVVEWEYTA